MYVVLLSLKVIIFIEALSEFFSTLLNDITTAYEKEHIDPLRQ